MPRRSSEAITGELFRAQQGQPLPPVPKHLKGMARETYCSILEHYPPSRFMGGAHLLLEAFAVVSAQLRQVMIRMQALQIDDPEGQKLSRLAVKMTATQVSLAVKLRLTPSSTYRADATHRLDERRPHLSPLIGTRN